MQYAVLGDWNFLLNIIIWRSIQVVAYLNSSFLFPAGYDSPIPRSECIGLFHHSPIEGYLGSFFQPLALTNKAVINICVHVFA